MDKHLSYTNNCLIFLEIINKKVCYFRCINCNQNVHLICVIKWIKYQKINICPVCREIINNFDKTNLVNLDKNENKSLIYL